jgi:hypothetical protein
MTNTSRAKNLPSDESVGELEPVAHFNGAMPTGVTVSHKGRIFVNFPKWGDEVPFTVSEIHNGGEKVVAYPDEATNQTNPNDPAALVSVQSAGFWIQVVLCFSQPSMEDQNLYAWTWLQTTLSRRFSFRKM